MALRPSKITSEIIQTCNKYFSSNAEVALRSVPPVSQRDAVKPHASYRYRISNLKKPRDLPEVNFKEDATTLFADLQPSANPEFKFDYNPPKWAEKSKDNSPFPASIKTKSRLHNTYSDQQKAEDKMLKYKMVSFTPMTRNMSTAIVRCYSKGPAENSGSGSCKKQLNKCYKAKTKDCRVGANRHCPRLKILDCAQSKGSNCKLNYLDPHCNKKFAPYPSYSESCAENLPDDPSECQQCPWRTCDGADTVEPGKPVRNRRNYSTSCSRHLDATTGVVLGPLIPPVSDVQFYLGKGKCGQTKQPCKQPPGPCEVRRQKEEEKRRAKEIRIPPKPKKASEDVNRMVLANSEGNSELDVLINSNNLDALKVVMNEPISKNTSSWIDVTSFEDNMYLNEQKSKWPNCHKKKKPKRPDEGTVDDQDLSIEYGNAEWWTGRGKKTVVVENKGKCPVEGCDNLKIRSKKTWQDLKTRTKVKEAAVRKYRNETGGGPQMPPPTLKPEDEVAVEALTKVSIEGHDDVCESLMELDIEIAENFDEQSDPLPAQSSSPLQLILSPPKPLTSPTRNPTIPTLIAECSINDSSNRRFSKASMLKSTIQASEYLGSIQKDYYEYKKNILGQVLQVKKDKLACLQRIAVAEERKAVAFEKLVEKGFFS